MGGNVIMPPEASIWVAGILGAAGFPFLTAGLLALKEMKPVVYWAEDFPLSLISEDWNEWEKAPPTSMFIFFVLLLLI